jgi:hypothetical protein
VIPLTDARGDAVEHIRTWTHGQTLARGRFQVVIASDGAESEVDRAVERLLEPHDSFRMLPGAGLLALYNAAAADAEAPWLLVTENHCRSEPDCLEQALKGLEARPGLEAARIGHGHITPGVTGELGPRWFDDVYEEWSGAWTRLNLAGFLIRRDVFESAGGLDERYGLFSPPLVAATLAERGAEVGLSARSANPSRPRRRRRRAPWPLRQLRTGRARGAYIPRPRVRGAVFRPPAPRLEPHRPPQAPRQADDQAHCS